jgi:hypothetical protein
MDGFLEIRPGSATRLVASWVASAALLLLTSNVGVAQQASVSPGEASDALIVAATYMLLDTSAESYAGQPTPKALRSSGTGSVLVGARVVAIGGGLDSQASELLAAEVARALGARGVDAGVAPAGIVQESCPMRRGEDGRTRRYCSFTADVGLVVVFAYPVMQANRQLRVPMSTFTPPRDAEGASIPSNFDIILEHTGGHWRVVDVRRQWLG